MLAALAILVACDDPATPTSLDLESWPATPETAVTARIVAVIGQLTPTDELLSRRGEPYVAMEAHQIAHSFGEDYYGLTLALDDEDHGALACEGMDGNFASCVKNAMDEGRECRTHRVGDYYNAECKGSSF